MRVMLTMAAVVSVMLAGCASDSPPTLNAIDCPDEFGDAYEEAYNANRTRGDVEDADGDCVPDEDEIRLGTDPHNATDYPSLEQLQGKASEPKVTKQTDTITVAVGVPGGGALTNPAVGPSFHVHENATLIYAEASWDTPAIDLDLALQEPGADALTWQHRNQEGLPGMPDNPHSITVKNPPTGEWQSTVFAKGATALTDVTFAITVFYGEETVPDGYTAL